MSTYSNAPRFLSLALASRRVIDELMVARRGELREPKLQAALSSVVDSLEKTNRGERFFASPSGSLFEHSEQRSVLREVLQESKPSDLKKSLDRLVERTDDQKGVDGDIQTVVDFFFAVETRALHRYEQGMSADE